MDCLIHHPYVGSIWLTRCVKKNGVVTGETLDTSECGSSYLPIDYPGEWVVMNFPTTCIVKQINDWEKWVTLLEQHHYLDGVPYKRKWLVKRVKYYLKGKPNIAVEEMVDKLRACFPRHSF